MSDEADDANDHIEREMAQRILAARRVRPAPKSTHCLNCGEPIKAGRYCGIECKEDDEARLKHLKRAGLG